jgi:hypothetical protein
MNISLKLMENAIHYYSRLISHFANMCQGGYKQPDEI